MSIKYENGEEVEMIIKTVKESQSGLFTNERLLLIKSGIVSYFSSIPKEFIGSYRTIELSGQIPKFTIAANEISKVELKGNELSLLVHKSKLIARDDFQKLVKGNDDVLKNKASKKYDLDHNGYEQWIFKCNQNDSLLQFYRLVNLFRTGDPKFQPQLSSVVEGFQKKKTARKNTIDPSQNARTAQIAKNRLSELSKPTTHFEIEEKPAKQPQVVPKIEIGAPIQEPAREQPGPEVQQKEEKQRLKEVIEKIANINQPFMEQIDERTNEDQLSYLSKDKPTLIHIIKTFQEESQPPSSNKQEEGTSQRQSQGSLSQAVIDTMDLMLANAEKNHESFLKEKAAESKKQAKTITEQKLTQHQQQDLLRSSRYTQSKTGFEIRQKKMRKINELLKVASRAANYNEQQIAKAVGMTVEQLREFVRINTIEEDSSWNFIQNELGKLINSTSTGIDLKHPIRPVTDRLIEEYHRIEGLSTKLEPSEMLEGEITVDQYEIEHQDDNQVLQWMKDKINGQEQRSFSSKVISNHQYKIAIRPLSFSKEQLLSIKSCWVLNVGGHLQQMLAYLYLQRTLREMQTVHRGQIVLECGDAIYLKYQDYEAIAKQMRVGYNYYPLKSIRALEFISRSKSIQRFYQNFPQFLISVEMLKEGQNYRFHLDRIPNSEHREGPLINQLKRFVFPFDNELDLFFQSSEFHSLQQKCVDKLNQCRLTKKIMNPQVLLKLFQDLDNHLEVDIICKLLGARISRNLDLQFQPIAVRLGNRQFGEELSLIRKARKVGDLQLSRIMSQQVMSRLQYYKFVTPVGNFIEIYLQLIDCMILERGQLHRAVSVLLRVVNALSEYEIEQYPVYLALMKTYLKLGEINNFITVLENCRLFISHMFKERAIVFDFPFVRVLMILSLRQHPQKALQIINRQLQQLENSPALDDQIRQRYMSKATWDSCNILLLLNKFQEAYSLCQKRLLYLQENSRSSEIYWVEGVLCLAKCWCEMEEVNAKNSAMVQKRLQRGIQQSLVRQNYQLAFMQLDIGQKVLSKCKDAKLPKILDRLPIFQQARIEFNATRDLMLQLIEEQA